MGGKALNERKAEMRIQFKGAPAADALFGVDVPRNEMVIRLQPEETIYMKSNIRLRGKTLCLTSTGLDRGGLQTRMLGSRRRVDMSAIMRMRTLMARFQRNHLRRKL